MGRYRLLVHGTNVTFRRLWFFRKRYGVYSTCFVEAATPQEAAEAALALLRDEPKLLLASLTVPQLEVEEIAEVDSFHGRPFPRTGLVFYEA